MRFNVECAPDSMFACARAFELLCELDKLLREAGNRLRRFRLARRPFPQDRPVHVAVADMSDDGRDETGGYHERLGPVNKLGEAGDGNADVRDLAQRTIQAE